MAMIKEFKEFIMRGNVVDLAIGVIIGAAFGKIVSSLVEDIITPILLKPALDAAGAANIEQWAPGGMLVGKFIAAVISFVVIAFVLFLIIKGINSTKKNADPAPVVIAELTVMEKLLVEIRDSLKK
ncbi:MAG: large conductance mechanosensitive channel protein MscL [Burkholderiales bacterium]|nr:large conductance mechanosensitive channel protein MscL [Bacteroidia bacterium]